MFYTNLSIHPPSKREIMKLFKSQLDNINQQQLQTTSYKLLDLNPYYTFSETKTYVPLSLKQWVDNLYPKDLIILFYKLY